MVKPVRHYIANVTFLITAVSTNVVPGLEQRNVATNNGLNAVPSKPGANYWPSHHSQRLQHRLKCSDQHTSQARQLVRMPTVYSRG
jgi:hypothetical protein